MHAKTIEQLKILLTASFSLTMVGSVVFSYLASDPDPQWWARNYPWIRAVPQSLLISGFGVLLLGLVLILLETKVTIDR